jgi:hypothetical protein
MKLKFLTAVILFLFIVRFVWADVPQAQAHEVEHLLGYVQSSDCIIYRNGTNYPLEKAMAHIKNKYEYFRDKIKSTEDFIAYSATKSTMSGKYYMVTCPGSEAIRTQDWLLAELKRFRSEKN